MPAIIAGRKQLDRDDHPPIRPNNLCVWGIEVTFDAVCGAYVDKPVVQADNADTSGCLGNVSLFFDPPDGRLRNRPRGRRSTHSRSPIRDKPACAANFATWRRVLTIFSIATSRRSHSSAVAAMYSRSMSESLAREMPLLWH